MCSEIKCLLGGVVNEASRVLGELDSRTHLKLSLMIENLVPIDKKNKNMM